MFESRLSRWSVRWMMDRGIGQGTGISAVEERRGEERKRNGEGEGGRWM
jgi:hypothetical protein